MVYARTVLVRRTEDLLNFWYHSKGRSKRVAQGGGELVLLSDKDKLRAKLGTSLSEPFSIAGSGVQGEFTLREEGRVLEFAYKTALSLAVEGEALFSKVVTVTPKWVVVNAC